MYRLTKKQLLRDLHAAYVEASKGKHDKGYVKKFERHLEKELRDLRDELWNGTYRPSPATCFPIHDPTQREILAAQFRDCIVNHLFHMYTHALFERTFIADSYACIKGKGTHYGIERLKRHIRSFSENHTKPCYVLQMDISGYFIHITRRLLCRIACGTVRKMSSHIVTKGSPERWGDILDIPFVLYLTRLLCLHNPVKDCIVLGSPAEWEGLPDSKCMRKAPRGKGIAIGNLDSQSLSNVFLNVLDQYVKRTLHVRHYGRSVDDFWAIGRTLKELRRMASKITTFLKDVLDLDINRRKTRIRRACDGVKFLGVFILPHSCHIAAGTLRRMKQSLRKAVASLASPEAVRDSVNSYLGIFSHTDSFRRRIAFLMPVINMDGPVGTFDGSYMNFAIDQAI